MRREYYRFFRYRGGKRPQRTPVLPAEWAKKADKSFSLFSGLKCALAGHERISSEITARLGAVHPWGKCESRLLRAAQLWLVDRAETESTVIRYIAALQRYIVASGLRRIDLHAQVSPAFLAGYRNHLQAEGLAPRTVNTALQILRSWYSWLYRLGLTRIQPYQKELLVPVDQAKLYHANRTAGVRRSLGHDQAQALLNWAWTQRPEVCAGIALLMGAGLRNQEARTATWAHVHEDSGQTWLTVTGKGSRTRRVALDPIAVAALHRLRGQPGRPVIAGTILRHEGHPITDDTLGRWVRMGGVAIERPDLTPHELRRTHATLMRDCGAPPEAAQLALGHASSETTRKHYDTGDRRWKGTFGLVTPSAVAAQEPQLQPVAGA